MVMNVEKDFQKMCCINCIVVNDNNKFLRFYFFVLVVIFRKVYVKKIRVIFLFIWLKNRDKIYLNFCCLFMYEYYQGVIMINICIFYFKIFECVQMVFN